MASSARSRIAGLGVGGLHRVLLTPTGRRRGTEAGIARRAECSHLGVAGPQVVGGLEDVATPHAVDRGLQLLSGLGVRALLTDRLRASTRQRLDLGGSRGCGLLSGVRLGDGGEHGVGGTAQHVGAVALADAEKGADERERSLQPIELLPGLGQPVQLLAGRVQAGL